MDYIDIFALVVVIFGVFVLSPILCYALYRFYHIRTAQLMKFRNLFLIYVINILVLFTMIFERVFVCSILIWNITKIPKWSIYIADGLCIWSIYLLFSIKTWLLYFEQKYHLSLINLTWKKLINQSTKSWYINNKNKYGNYKYLLKIAVIPYCFYIFTEIIINIYTNFDVVIITFINWMLTAFPLIFICIIYYKCHSKQFKDIYKISNEIKYQCIVIIIYLVMNTAFIIICIYHDENTNNIHRIEALCDLILIYIVLFGIAIFSTAYPVFLYYNKLNSNQLSIFMNSNGYKRRGGIKQIGRLITNIDGFKYFMLHLLQELSTENLVFLVELIQIKHSFQQRNNNLILIPKQSSFPIKYKTKTKSKDTDILDIPEPLNLSENNTMESNVTINTNTNTTPQHSNNNSNETDAEYDDDNKYMIVDFNISSNPLQIQQQSPSPPPPPPSMSINTSNPCKTTDIGHNDDTMAYVTQIKRCQSQTNIELKSVHIHKSAQSLPKLPPHSTYLQRATSRSKSRTFSRSRKKKSQSVYSYLFNTNSQILMKIELPPGLPKSAVLDDDEKSNNFALEMEYLYNKFIKRDSLYEINLSHSLRAPLIRLFETDKLHLQQQKESFLFNIFDECALNILELMLDSYHRFILTDNFKLIVHELDAEEHEDDLSINNYGNHTPQSHHDNNNNDIINNQLPILRNASSYNKLLMQYATN